MLVLQGKGFLMPWFKVDDGFTTSDKVTAIPRKDRLLAIGLWTYAGNYSARVLNDGLVPAHMLDDIDAPQEMVEHLIRVGLWDRDEQGQIWFHDWCEYQPSATEHKEKQQATRDKRSAAGKNGAAIRWGKQDDGKPIAKAWQNDSKTIANEWQTDSPEPEPEPEPEPSIPNGIDIPAQVAFDEKFDDFWAIYPRRENKQSARRAFKQALKAETLETIIAGALRYREDPNRDPAFTKHAATWLNNQCWNDDPLPAKNNQKLANQQSAREAFLNATTTQPAITSEPDWAINE